MTKNPMKKYWTADFKKFKKKVESVFGDINRLADYAPDIYAHQVLSHGFMEYAGIKMIPYKKWRQNYLKWTKKHKLKLVEEGRKAFLDD